METPLVGIVMGSASDYETLAKAEDVLLEFDVPYEISVVSAHRMPEEMFDYAKSAAARGSEGPHRRCRGAADLPGMVSALTTLPVLGVPVQAGPSRPRQPPLYRPDARSFRRRRSPSGACAGRRTRRLFAARVLALSDLILAAKLAARSRGAPGEGSRRERRGPAAPPPEDRVPTMPDILAAASSARCWSPRSRISGPTSTSTTPIRTPPPCDGRRNARERLLA